MAYIKDMDAFAYDDTRANLSIAALSKVFNKPDEEPDYEGAVEQILSGFEKNGARNIITKQEEFTTTSGVPGIRVFGRGEFKLPDSDRYLKAKYTILLFGGNGYMQQVILSWEEEDQNAEENESRILKTNEEKTVIREEVISSLRIRSFSGCYSCCRWLRSGIISNAGGKLPP